MVFGPERDESGLINFDKIREILGVSARIVRSFRGVDVQRPPADHRGHFARKDKKLSFAIDRAKFEKSECELFKKSAFRNVRDRVSREIGMTNRAPAGRASKARISAPCVRMGEKDTTYYTGRDF